ncbi:MAG: hypothetical protein ACK551_03290 [Vampirovibrionales bacterium]
MSSTYTAVSQKFTCVFLNYKHKDVESFETALKDRTIWERYNLREADTEIETDAPLHMIPVLMKRFPLRTYKLESLDAKLEYVDFESKVMISKMDPTEEELQELEKFITEIADFKISDIEAMGINFITVYELPHKKLQVLNQNIEEVFPNFSKNKTFQLILPLQLDGYVATYQITKNVKEKPADEEPRRYTIDVNFHIDIESTSTTTEKFKKITSNVAKISTDYYKEYLSDSENILGMNCDVKI